MFILMVLSVLTNRNTPVKCSGTRTGLKMSEEAANVRKRPSANLETIAGEHVRVGASASIMGRLPASPARAHNMSSAVIVQMFSACSDTISRCFQRSPPAFLSISEETCFCPSVIEIPQSLKSNSARVLMHYELMRSVLFFMNFIKLIWFHQQMFRAEVFPSLRSRDVNIVAADVLCMFNLESAHWDV